MDDVHSDHQALRAVSKLTVPTDDAFDALALDDLLDRDELATLDAQDLDELVLLDADELPPYEPCETPQTPAAPATSASEGGHA